MPHLWSGRFDEEPDPSVFQYGVSLQFDRQLFEDDVTGSLAWAEAIARDRRHLGRRTRRPSPPGLAEILETGRARPGVRDGRRTRTSTRSSSGSWSSASARRASACTPGARATSRCRSTCASISSAASRCIQDRLRRLVGALAHQAAACGDAVLPSYTHLRRAQPILAAHFLLAHAAAFRRDYDRFAVAIAEADAMPLGSGAIAGTTYAVDTRALADRLGFSRVVANSLDASSDRDFVATFLYACVADDGAPQPARGGRHHLHVRGVRLLRAAGSLRHGQQPDAAEEEPRSDGARPRQVRAASSAG